MEVGQPGVELALQVAALPTTSQHQPISGLLFVYLLLFFIGHVFTWLYFRSCKRIPCHSLPMPPATLIASPVSLYCSLGLSTVLAADAKK